MLDVAPKTNEELIYPDWGGEEVSPNASLPAVTSSHNVAQRAPAPSQPYQAMSDIRGLMRFMDANQIAYQLIPGQHTVIKLEKRIHFKTGSAAITAQSTLWLNQLGAFLASKPNIKTVIDGHTDSTGGNQINDSLSDKRALQVKLLLTRQNVATSNVYTRGYGKHLPSCSNLSKRGKACNRRVELMFIEAIQ